MDIPKLEKQKNTKDIRYITKRILSVLGSNNGMVLDIGCGWGFWTKKLQSKSKIIVGTDIRDIFDKNAIHQKLRFVLADAINLPFNKEFFGCITLFETLEHFSEDYRALKEIDRVLKSGGRLILTVPNKDRLANRIRKLIGRPVAYPLSLGIDYYNPSDTQEQFHFREYSEEEIVQLLYKFGFVDINIEGVGFGIGKFLIWAKAYLFKKFSKTWLIFARKI